MGVEADLALAGDLQECPSRRQVRALVLIFVQVPPDRLCQTLIVGILSCGFQPPLLWLQRGRRGCRRRRRRGRQVRQVVDLVVPLHGDVAQSLPGCQGQRYGAEGDLERGLIVVFMQSLISVLLLELHGQDSLGPAPFGVMADWTAGARGRHVERLLRLSWLRPEDNRVGGGRQHRSYCNTGRRRQQGRGRRRRRRRWILGRSGSLVCSLPSVVFQPRSDLGAVFRGREVRLEDDVSRSLGFVIRMCRTRSIGMGVPVAAPRGRADEWFLAGMQSLVSLELAGLCEGSTASRIVANVGSLSSMCPQMGLKKYVDINNMVFS